MVFRKGLNSSVAEDGIYVETEVTEAGVFETISDPRKPEYDIGIAMMIVTFDAKGQTSTDRQVAYRCTRLLPVCRSVYGDSSAAFQPGFFVDIPGTGVPTLLPSPLPVFSPTPAPTAFPQPTLTLAPGYASPAPSAEASPSPMPSRNTGHPSRAPTGKPSATPAPSPLPSRVTVREPTEKPSVTPSPTVTEQPSAVPTASPTGTFNCSYSEDGAMEPNPYLMLAHPSIEVSSGSAYILSPTYITSESIIGRSFGLLSSAAPSSGFTFVAKLNDRKVGTVGGGGSTLPERSASVKVVLKTPTVYHDSAVVEVAYQLRDASGRSQVLRTGLTVKLTLTNGASVSTIACGSASSSTGIGLCRVSVAAAWFSTAADVSVGASAVVAYSSLTAVTSEAMALTLRQEPSFTALASSGMVMTLPQRPMVRGESFAVQIDANTNGQALDVWILEVAYDASILQYVSTTTSSLFKTAVVNSDASAGTVTMTTGCLDSGVEAANATGSDVYVVTLTFQVLSAASAGAHANVLSLYVSDMVNVATIQFGAGLTGQTNDERGGT